MAETTPPMSTAELLAALEGGGFDAGAQQAEFIGVPPDFAGAPGQQFRVPLAHGQLEDSPNVPPQFREGDQHQLLSMSPEDIWQLQQAMAQAGVLTGQFRRGLADDATMQAYRELLGWANRLGTGRRPDFINATLQTLAASPEFQAEGGGVKQGGAEALIRRRDPVELAQVARDSIRSLLGRDPDDAEIQDAASALAGFDLTAARQNAEMGSSALGGDITLVNPEARFRAFLEDRYRPEIDRIETVQNAVVSRENMMANLGAIDRMIGG